MDLLKAIREALLDMFSPLELKTFVYDGPQGREIIHQLPTATTPNDLALQVVEEYRRRGLIGPELFARWASMREGRAGEVHALRDAWRQLQPEGEPPQPQTEFSVTFDQSDLGGRWLSGLVAQVAGLTGHELLHGADPGADAEPSGSLYSPSSTVRLRDLALIGRELLLRVCAATGSPEHSERELAEAASVQIFSRSPEVIPFEIAYDAEAPEPDAPICPSAGSSLVTGRCSEDCPSARHTVVCPRAFWGLHKVIERPLQAPSASSGGVVTIGTSAVQRDKAVLKGMSKVGLALSHRVGIDSQRRLETAIRSSAGASVVQPVSWGDWVDFVQQVDPGLLILVAHTWRENNGHLVLGIGDDSRLRAINLRQEHLRRAGSNSDKVVLYFGDGGILAEVMRPLRRHGARAVFASLGTLTGRQAGFLAGTLFQRIAAAIGEPVNLGATLRDLRRELLLEGYPVGLGLVLFGDADWRLAG